MDSRKSHILKTIIEYFIESADPVGSQTLLSSGKFEVSSATIRNDMAYLESVGLIYQPHTSAGRIPTAKGFRIFVDELMDEISDQMMEKDRAIRDVQQFQQSELDAKIRQAISQIAKLTNCVSFATLPWMHEAYYLGIANVLRNREFHDVMKASTIVEVLEDTDRFTQLLMDLGITRKIQAFIGDENAIEGIQSCTLLATLFERGSYIGVIGILGPVRMHYAYNMKLLEVMREVLES